MKLKIIVYRNGCVCVSGCMNDVRFNGKWFPMLQEENGESIAADYMERSQNIEFGCESNMCGAGSGFVCPYELLCFDLWRHAECRSVFYWFYVVISIVVVFASV